MAKFVVGLRGGIGTGKSAVSNIFESLGVDIADADISSRNVMKPGEEAFKKVVDHFGKGILDSAGEINRPRLRKIVFSKPEEKILLENLTVPSIIEDLLKKIQLSSSEYVMLVLSTGSGKTSLMNRLLVVDAKKNTQIKRVMERDKTCREEVEAIIATQPDRKDRLKGNDDLILNEGLISDLERQVMSLHKKYLNLARANITA
ncbi:MAG: dephospho-CoA kinase [Gammaproteobacteria bacterium]|nr:dephospho-CoA kinase [Gammaproteobacteria bacterium]